MDMHRQILVYRVPNLKPNSQQLGLLRFRVTNYDPSHKTPFQVAAPYDFLHRVSIQTDVHRQVTAGTFTPHDTVSPPLSLFGGAFGTPQAVPRSPARGQTVVGVCRSPIPGHAVTRVGHSPARWTSRTVRRLQSDFRPEFSRAHGAPIGKADSKRKTGLAAVWCKAGHKIWSSDHPIPHVVSPKVTSIKKYNKKSHVGSPGPSTTTKHQSYDYNPLSYGRGPPM